MKTRLKKKIKFIIPLLFGLFLVWYSLRVVPLSKIIEYFKLSNKYWILLGLLFAFLSHLSRAYRWRFQLEPMGYKIRYGNSIMAVFATYLINYTIPRAGEVARASIITNYENVPFDKAFGTIVAERIADLIMMFGVITITLFLQFDFIYKFLIAKFNVSKIITLIGFFIILLLLFYFYVKKSNAQIAKKIKTFVSGLIEGILSIFKIKRKLAYIFHTLFIWLMYVLMFYITSLAINDLSGLALGAILVGFISGSFSIVATNGGIGSYPLAIYAAFSIFAIPEEPSIAFGWIMWGAQTLMVIICGGLSLIYLPIYNRNYNNI